VSLSHISLWERFSSRDKVGIWDFRLLLIKQQSKSFIGHPRGGDPEESVLNRPMNLTNSKI
jgi:hypothetical protein